MISKILIAITLMLATVSPAFAQSWIELETTNCPSAWHGAPNQCPDPFGSLYWGRIYQSWPWSPPNAGPWTIESSMGPIIPPSDFGVRLSSWWMPEYPSNDWHAGCSEGWWDLVAFGTRMNYVTPTTYFGCEDPSYLVVDPANPNEERLHYPMIPDNESGDQHWPIPEDAYDSPPPSGTWRYEANTSTISTYGSIGGFPFGSLWDAEVCEVIRDGMNVRIYIGPRFATSDFNRDGVVTAPDIFNFLAAWFANDSRAGLCDGCSGCQAADIFSFLTTWFQED